MSIANQTNCNCGERNQLISCGKSNCVNLNLNSQTGEKPCFTLCANDYKDYLVYELSIGASEHTLKLKTQLEFIWQIIKPISAGNLELRYLYAKRELLSVLMGCYYQNFDIEQGTTTATDQSQSQRQSNIQGGSQASNHSHSLSVSCSKSEYDDSSKGFMEALAKRESRSDTTDIAQSFSEDKGRGASLVIACNDESAESASNSLSTSASKGVGRGQGQRKGREYEFSQSTTQGSGKVPLITKWQITANTSTWDRDMFNRTKSDDAQIRRGSSFRENKSSNKSERKAQKESCSFFQSAVMSCSQGTSDMVSCDISRSTRDAEAKSSGFGFSEARYDLEGRNGSQGSAESHSDHEFHSIGNGAKNANYDAKMNSQKFKHLQELYSQITKEITLARKIVISSQGYATGKRLLDAELYGCIMTFTEKIYCISCNDKRSSCGCYGFGNRTNKNKSQSNFSFSYGGY